MLTVIGINWFSRTCYSVMQIAHRERDAHQSRFNHGRMMEDYFQYYRA